MDSRTNPVSILILTSQEDEAERLATSLRNGGLAVYRTFTSQPERLRDLTDTQAFDLILCCDYDPAIDLALCMRYYRELDRDLPLVVIADEQTDSASLIAAMRAGARDLTEHRDTQHLQLVVARELADLEHRRAEGRLRERLRDCEQRAGELVDASSDAVAFVKEGMHVRANPAYRQVFGFGTPEDMDGFPLLDLISPDRHAQTRRALRALESGRDEAASIQVQCVRADGSRFEARLSAFRSNLDGEPCLRVMVREEASQASPAGPGLLDTDTGLPNRAALMAELAVRLEPGSPDRTPFAVLYVGIQGFQAMLQRLGLSAGLAAAAAFAASLRRLIPAGAFLARFGDDAFVVLVKGITEAEATRLAARIVREARLPPGPGMVDPKAPICSVGLTLAEPMADSATSVLDQAYRYYLFGPSAQDRGPIPTGSPTASAAGVPSEVGKDMLQFVSLIDDALQGEGFELVYQPIVSLKGDSQENYSVLLRLRDHERSLREAKEFFAAAARSGRMVAIDRWVIRHAVEGVAAKRSEGERLNLFVTIAEETLQEEDLLFWICDCLRKSQVRGNWLTVQVHAEHAGRHPAAFAKLCEGLRKVKCRVAINRFGMGPDQEKLLENLSADFVGFAPELVQGLADDVGKQRRLLDLARLARNAGSHSIVTGVEDVRTLKVVWTAGIDYVQGNFLQQPTATIESQESF